MSRFESESVRSPTATSRRLGWGTVGPYPRCSSPWPPETRLLNRYLNEALATERALITTLTAHLATTPRGDVPPPARAPPARDPRPRGRLSSRLDAPRQQPDRRRDRPRRDRRRPGPEPRQGPARPPARRHGQAETLLKNAKDECATEALEIATYDAIEALAAELGDSETAALAARPPRRRGARCCADLRALIPALAGATVHGASRALRIAGSDDHAGQRGHRLSELSQIDLASTRGVRAAADAQPADRSCERAERADRTSAVGGLRRGDAREILARLDAAIAAAVRDYESRAAAAASSSPRGRPARAQPFDRSGSRQAGEGRRLVVVEAEPRAPARSRSTARQGASSASPPRRAASKRCGASSPSCPRTWTPRSASSCTSPPPAAACSHRSWTASPRSTWCSPSTARRSARARSTSRPPTTTC